MDSGPRSDPTSPPNRRDRLRATTISDIKNAARQRVVAEGVAGVSLRAIARDLGMTAPGLYRYFESREALLTAVIADTYENLADAVAGDDSPDDPGERLLGMCRRFRAWALTHTAEFGLIFGSPLPGYAAPEDGPTTVAGQRFSNLWLSAFRELWISGRFAVPDPGTLAPAYAAKLARWHEELDGAVPLEVLSVFLECWAQLYGQVCLEAFGHLSFALDDPEPMFEQVLAQLAARIGIPARDLA